MLVPTGNRVATSQQTATVSLAGVAKYLFPMKKSRGLMSIETKSVIGAVALILGLALVGYLTVGFAGALFSVAFIGGLILWLLTTYRTPIDPQTIIVPYLVTVILFIVHVYEEFVAHVEHLLTKLSGLPVTQTNFLVIAAFSAPIVWLLGCAVAKLTLDEELRRCLELKHTKRGCAA